MGTRVVAVQEIEGEHYVFSRFTHSVGIMESLTSVDKSRIKHAFQKALNSYDEHALNQQKMKY